MSMKQLGIRIMISLENIDQKIFGRNSSQLNRYLKSPGGLHLIYSQLVSLDLVTGTGLCSGNTAMIAALQKLCYLQY